MAKNRPRGDEARRDCRIDTQSGHQRHEVRPFDERDDAPRPIGLGQQGGDEIGAFVVRHGNHRVHVRDAFLPQQPQVRGVAMQHQGIRQAVGQHLTARRVLLQQPHVVVRVVLFQHVRHVVAHSAAADDKHLAGRV